MVPNIEKDCILLLGIVFYIRNITLPGFTAKKNATHVRLAREWCLNSSVWDAGSFLVPPPLLSSKSCNQKGSKV